jgi:hypothetical protein
MTFTQTREGAKILEAVMLNSLQHPLGSANEPVDRESSSG